MLDPRLLTGVFLGWSLGANDAANVFGTAVSSHMIRWRTAAILIAVFVLIGALLQGGAGLATYAGLTAKQSVNAAAVIALAAALTTAGLTLLHLPVSTSQAVVGAMLGAALAQHQTPDWGGLQKIALCWIGTPVGAAVLAIVLYPLLAALVARMKPHFLIYDRLMRDLLYLAGIYGAYALGANNVANVTGVFYDAGMFDAFGASGSMGPRTAALLVGGLAIGFGALTYSKGVMLTVGRSIVPLDAFSAFVVVLCEAITVHIYSMIGVPVSTSQAVVGAVVGIGLLKGMRTVSVMALVRIGAGWIVTPIAGGLLAAGLMRALG